MEKARIEVRVVYQFKDKFDSAAGHVKPDEIFYIMSHHADNAESVGYEVRQFVEAYCPLWIRAHYTVAGIARSQTQGV